MNGLFGMYIWNRLLQALGYTHASRLSFQFDQKLLESLEEIAARERRQTSQVAADLLLDALVRRSVTDENLQRWYSLSPREQEIAALVRLNYTNRQIAARLAVSPETVKTHVRNMLRKFGLRSKAELRQALAEWDFNSWENALL